MTMYYGNARAHTLLDKRNTVPYRGRRFAVGVTKQDINITNTKDSGGTSPSAARASVSLLAESPVLRRDMKRYIGVQE